MERLDNVKTSVCFLNIKYFVYVGLKSFFLHFFGHPAALNSVAVLYLLSPGPSSILYKALYMHLGKHCIIALYSGSIQAVYLY